MDNGNLSIEEQIAGLEERLHEIPQKYAEALTINEDESRELELDRINKEQSELRSTIKQLKNQREAETTATVQQCAKRTDIKWVKDVDSGELYPVEAEPVFEIPGHLRTDLNEKEEYYGEEEEDIEADDTEGIILNMVKYPCEEVLSIIKSMNDY